MMFLLLSLLALTSQAGSYETHCVMGIVVEPRADKGWMSFRKCKWAAAETMGQSFIHGAGPASNGHCYIYDSKQSVAHLDSAPKVSTDEWRSCTITKYTPTYMMANEKAVGEKSVGFLIGGSTGSTKNEWHGGHADEEIQHLPLSERAWVDKHCSTGINPAPHDRINFPMNILECRTASERQGSKTFVYSDNVCYVYREHQNFNLLKMLNTRTEGHDKWMYCVQSLYEDAVGETGVGSMHKVGDRDCTAEEQGKGCKNYGVECICPGCAADEFETFPNRDFPLGCAPRHGYGYSEGEVELADNKYGNPHPIGSCCYIKYRFDVVPGISWGDASTYWQKTWDNKGCNNKVSSCAALSDEVEVGGCNVECMMALNDEAQCCHSEERAVGYWMNERSDGGYYEASSLAATRAAASASEDWVVYGFALIGAGAAAYGAYAFAAGRKNEQYTTIVEV